MEKTRTTHQKILGPVFCLLTALAMPANLSAQESPFYLGGSVWRAGWNVGLSDKQSENSRDGSVISNAVANAALRAVFTTANQYQTFFVNAPSNAELTNVGLFGTYGLSDLWTLTFNAAYGTTTFKGSRQILFGYNTTSTGTGGFSAGALDHDVTAERKDLDAVFARRIAESPFAFFSGLKVQDWYYEAKPVTGISPFSKTTTGSGGAVLSASGAGAAGFRYAYNSRTIGPTIGAIYTLPIGKEQALSFQAGLLYLFGNLKMIEKSDGASPAASLTNGSQVVVQPANSYLIRDEIKDKLQMPGFSVTAYYRRSLGSVSLRIGLFYQETTALSKDPKDTGYTYIYTGEDSIVLPATPRRLQPEFSVNGAKDIFKGLAVSVVTRVW